MENKNLKLDCDTFLFCRQIAEEMDKKFRAVSDATRRLRDAVEQTLNDPNGTLADSALKNSDEFCCSASEGKRNPGFEGVSSSVSETVTFF